MKSMAPEQGIHVLEHLLESGDVQTVVWPPDWKEWAGRYPAFVRTSFVADLLAAPPSSQTGAPARRFGDAFGAMSKTERPRAVAAYMACQIAERLRIPVEELPVDLPLERLGFDSLQATELQTRLVEDLGVRVPVMRFLGFSSIASIAEEVVERLENAFASRSSELAGPILRSDVRTLGAEGSTTAAGDPGEPLRKVGS
jgi:acyl carrier protein